MGAKRPKSLVLHKYPKGRISNLTSLWFGNVSQKAVKLARATDGFFKINKQLKYTPEYSP